MPGSADLSVSLRRCFAQPVAADSSVDYELREALEGTYAARTREGAPALVIPLGALPADAAGRRAGGCELLGHTSIRVSHDGRSWDCAAAALVCHEPELIDSFVVLASDVVRKTDGNRTWKSVASVVDEWLTLLAPRGRPSVESEIGLWGELWFIANAANVGRLLSGWRGPEGDNVDFFLGGASAEVKASRTRHRHFVSQTQVGAPVGELPAWVLSMWVKADPRGGQHGTVPELVDRILAAVDDRAGALRRILRAGYSAADRTAYTMTLALLEEPSWFSEATIPRVRLADAGISNLRYQVTLDDARRAEPEKSRDLWLHFHERTYGAAT